jgi:hypothetical protein
MTTDRGNPACGKDESCYSCEKLRRPCTFQAGIENRAGEGYVQPSERLFACPRIMAYSVIAAPMHMEAGVERGPTAVELGGDGK